MNELFKKIKGEKMTAAEKQAGFSRLQAFMLNHPATSLGETPNKKILSPFNNNLLLHHRMLASAFVFIFLVSATGGTSLAARYSIPGDTLYPIKINVNEKVETFAAFTSEAKADVEAKHVDERLVEAEVLTEKDKFSSTLKTQVETQFSQDLQNAMIHVNTLNSQGDSKNARRVKTSVENSLQKHKTVVEKILNTTNAQTNVSSKRIAPRAMTPVIEAPSSASDTSVSTFSATMTATSTGSTTNLKAESRTTINIESSNESENDKTPLLDETLDRIFNAK